MFDRTIILPTQNRTQYLTSEVKEHRAPTDQSVALLKEMEAAARAKVIESIKVGDTVFECVVHIEFDGNSGDVVYLAVFSLNGKKMTVEHRASVFADKDDPKKWVLELRDKIGREIASTILQHSLSGLWQLKGQQ